jgi:hypothetical protein
MRIRPKHIACAVGTIIVVAVVVTFSSPAPA